MQEKKRIGIIILMVALGLMLGAMFMVATSPVAALTTDDLNFEYQIIGGGSSVEIVQYNGTGAVVTIPGTIDSLPVTSIGAWAFANNSVITRVTVPDRVGTIGESAFSQCTSLTRLEFTGNQPTSVGPNWADGSAGIIVYYQYGATGFTSPTWQGVSSIAICHLTMIANGGTTSAGGTFNEGAQVTLSATPPTGNAGEQYVWDRWSGTGTGSYSGTDPTPTITIGGDITQDALWTKQYLISFAVTPNGAGSVTPASGQYHDAGSLSIQATPTGGYTFSSWSSNNGGITFGSQSSASTTASIGGAGTITANFVQNSVQVTITSSPAGSGYVLVDDQATDTPATFDWLAGSHHTIEATTSVPVGSNERYQFTSWSDSGAQTHSYTVTGAATVTANFAHQYLVTMVAGGGTTTPSAGTHWANAGSQLTLDASPPTAGAGAQYAWNGWTGSGTGAYTGTARPATNAVTVNGPITETADWNLQYQLTMASNVGTTAPSSGSWYDAGTKVTITATHPTTVTGEQYTFVSWAGSGTGSYDGTANPATNAVTMDGPITETATWSHQYLLTTGANFGTVEPASGTWYNAGTQVTLTATHPTTVTGEQYLFVSWAGTGTGSYDGTSNPATNAVTMNGPITETATWNHQFRLTMVTNFGTTTPATGTWYNAGTQVTLTATHPTTITGEQYLFDSWTGSGTGSYDGTANPATNAVTMNAPITENAVWSHQYQVSFAVSPPGGGTVSPTGTNVWKTAGPQSIQALPSSGYAYASWSSDNAQITFDAQSASTVASIEGPGTITATFSVLPVGVTVTSSPTGAGYVLVDGTLITTPHTFSWLPGESHSLEATATVSAGTNARYTFTSWSDGSARLHSYLVNASTATITASYAHQYLVTMAADQGTTTPAAGAHWYNSNTQLTLDAAPPSASTSVRYVWNGWTGTGTGSYTGPNQLATNAVTVSGPITETANWTTQYLASFVASPAAGGTVSPSGLVWENAGPLSIQASQSAGYSFTSWSSDTASITFGAQTASTTAAINGPGMVTATFALQPVIVTITSNPTGPGHVLVDGTAVTTPNTFSWMPGSVHSIEAVNNLSVGAGEMYSFTSWSDAGARVHSYTVAGAATVTANFAHQYLVAMAANMGTTTPTIGGHWYNAGTQVTLDAAAPVAGTGVRYVWNGWTGTGTGGYTGISRPATNAITVNGPITETASWTKQYQVSFAVSPSGGGNTTPTGTGQWFDAGSLSILATPAKDYAFSSWTSQLDSVTFNAQTASTVAVLNGPGTITGNFVLALGITITSSPTGSGYVLVDGNAVVTPANFKWTSGNHTIQAVSTVPGVTGERYVFGSWSDGKAQTHIYTVNSLTDTVIAIFDHQYLLTMLTSQGNTTPAASTWERAGSKVGISAAAPPVSSPYERYQWVGWIGSGSGSSNGTSGTPSVDIMMNGPITETAVWSHQYQVTISTNHGMTNPTSGVQWMVQGSSFRLNATAPVAAAFERYVFNGWVGVGSGSYTGIENPVSVPILVNGPLNETATWIRQQVPDAPGNLTANSSDASVRLNWTAPADGGLAIDHYVVYQDGAQVATVNGLTITISSLTNGQVYSFEVAAHNLIGNGPNSSHAVIKPMKGITGPDLEITSPISGTYERTGSVLLEWTVSDPSSDIAKTEVSRDGKNWSMVSGTSQLMGGFPDGTYYLYVKVTDAANNVLTRAVSVVFDSTGPEISITSPVRGGFVGSHNITVGWTIVDLVSGVAGIEMSSDGTNWTDQVGNSGPLTALDGDVTVWVRAIDKAGNTRTARSFFTVDTVPPEVLDRSPTGSDESTLTPITVYFNEGMNRTSTSVSVQGMQGTAQWDGDNITFTFSEALLGRTTYTVTVHGVDLAGNSAWANWTFQTAMVGKITGILYGHDGKPLPNTNVRLFIQSTAARTELGHFALAASAVFDKERDTTSDANGTFTFYDVPIGNYTLEFTENGYLPKSMGLTMTADTISTGGLVVQPGMLHVEPGSGFILIFAVAAVCAAMVAAIFLIRRARKT